MTRTENINLGLQGYLLQPVDELLNHMRRKEGCNGVNLRKAREHSREEEKRGGRIQKSITGSRPMPEGAFLNTKLI